MTGIGLCIYVYIVSLLPATAFSCEFANGADPYVVAARSFFWPLFLLKLILRVIFAGAKDLAA